MRFENSCRFPANSHLAWILVISSAFLALPHSTCGSPAQSSPADSPKGSDSEKSAAAGARDTACPAGVKLSLSAPLALQGSLVLAEVRSKRPLAMVRGTWGGRQTPFWREEPSAGSAAPTPGKPGEIWHALAGVDLEKPAGTYRFSLSAKRPGKEAFVCSVLLRVRKGNFAVERLQVNKEFTEPSAEQLQRASRERERLIAIFDTVTPEKLWKGGFRIPLDGVTTGGNFGRRRVLNGNPGSPHSGVDLRAALGTPVYAAQRGRVVLAEELFFSGNTVVLDHGLGVYTFYGHLESIAVHPGEMAEAGTELGKAGATGRVTGPHLHWGLTVERARVDALQLVHLLPQ